MHFGQSQKIGTRMKIQQKVKMVRTLEGIQTHLEVQKQRGRQGGRVFPNLPPSFFTAISLISRAAIVSGASTKPLGLTPSLMQVNTGLNGPTSL